MDKYKKLISNTVIFAIGTFSSKVLVFLLMPLYTTVLSNEEYGVTDLLVQTGNLLLPLVSLGIVNAVVRFGLDKSVRKTDVFSTGLLTIFCGFGVLLAFWPLLNQVDVISGHTGLIYAFVLMSSLRSLCSQFTRARGLVRLYAFDGILSTVTTILFNVLFLVAFGWGISGYVLAMVCSDFISVAFLFFTGRLSKYIRIGGMEGSTVKAMLKYAVPMIPNTMFWWITNVSDRYIVTALCGEGANGLYAVAYKIPSIVVLISGIFMDAWQLSAVTEEKARARFFTKVFRSYSALIMMAASGIILVCKLMTKLLVSDEFYDSWQYIPLLVLATAFSCLVNFLGSVYMVKKKSMLSLVTTAAGAGLNIGLNFLLIPMMGVNGAALATFASYVFVFLLRAVSARWFIFIDYGTGKLFANTLLLVAQSACMLLQPPYWALLQAAFVLLIFAVNSRELLENAEKLLHRKPKPSKKASK